MRRLVLSLGLLCWNFLPSGGVATAEEGSSDVPLAADLSGSCEFQGVFAGGCIEFLGAGWTSANMQSFCQSRDRPGETAVVSSAVCPKANFNALCTSKKDEGLANVYVNDMPAFICKKYLKGDLTSRSDGGW